MTRQTASISPTSWGIVTKSDAAFFPGLAALLGSVSRILPGVPVTVLDCGLESAQRDLCIALGAKVCTVDVSKWYVPWDYYSPAIYGFFHHDIDAHQVTVHLDADTLVLGFLDELVASALEHGLAAVPDHPPLTLRDQIGDADVLMEIQRQLPELHPEATAFNAGVFAVRRDYYKERMYPTIERLRPLHTRLYGNDQALLNLAAFQANPRQPFYDVGRRFNARPRYRRAQEVAPLRRCDTATGPRLIGAEGDVRVLHFVGRLKPWHKDYPLPCAARDVWRLFLGSS